MPRSDEYEAELAARHVIYHMFAKHYGWSRSEVDKMTSADLEFALNLMREDDSAETEGSR